MSTLDKRKKDRVRMRDTNMGCLIAMAVPLILITIAIIVLAVIKMMQNGG